MKAQENTIDTVYGCTGGKTNGGHGCPWGCYAKFTTRRFGLGDNGFDTPVAQVLDERRLKFDLLKVEQDWIRFGVNGDPCFDWDLTAKTAKIVHEANKIPVIITRFWEFPTKKILKKLAENNVMLHASVCSLDADKKLGKIIKTYQTYAKLNGQYVFRLVTFAFNGGDKGNKFENKQNIMSFWVNTIEQPARVRTTNPLYKRLLDVDQMFKATSSGIKNPKHGCYYSAGPLYDYLPQCWSKCDVCANQCMTA